MNRRGIDFPPVLLCPAVTCTARLVYFHSSVTAWAKIQGAIFLLHAIGALMSVLSGAAFPEETCMSLQHVTRQTHRVLTPLRRHKGASSVSIRLPPTFLFQPLIFYFTEGGRKKRSREREKKKLTSCIRTCHVSVSDKQLLVSLCNLPVPQPWGLLFPFAFVRAQRTQFTGRTGLYTCCLPRWHTTWKCNKMDFFFLSCLQSLWPSLIKIKSPKFNQSMYNGPNFTQCEIATVNTLNSVAPSPFFRGGYHRRRYAIPTLLWLPAYCVEGLRPRLMKSEYTLLRLVWPVTLAAEYQPRVSDTGPRLLTPLCTMLAFFLHGNWRLVRICGVNAEIFALCVNLDSW